MDPIIEVNHLCKSFRDFEAVSDLNFTLYKGDILGFLGENGAGKSTTIRMLLTLIRPDSGSIRILGENLLEKRNEVLRHVGAVIERPDLYKYLSAYDNLNLFARMGGCRYTRKQLLEQLDVVGLADRSESKVKTFSQGMKQRLGIAVALVHDPELIILDEPTNGLDPQGIADIRNLILKLNHERGKSILVSSHLLSEMEIIASRLLIIHKGKKMVEGNTSSLTDPTSVVVKMTTADNTTSLNILHQSQWVEKPSIHDNQLHFTALKNDIPSIIRLITEKGIDIYMVQPVQSLENYFLHLTKTMEHVPAAAN